MKSHNEKILAVVNPISGNRDKDPIINMIKERLSSKETLTVLKTTGQNDKHEVSNAIKELEPHRIIAVGGDGTIKLIAEARTSLNPVIGIVAAGSANGLATDLKLPDSIGESVKIALGDKFIDVDNLCIGDQLCIHISDMGLNAELISRYSDQPVRGYLGYALSAVPALSKVNEKYHFQIETPSNSLETEAIMVAFANCKKFGTGVVINPGAKVNDGLFEVLIFKNFDALEVIKTLNGNISMDSEFVEVIQTNKVQVTADRPVPFQIDGEGCGSTSQTTVTIRQGNMKIAVGNYQI